MVKHTDSLRSNCPVIMKMRDVADLRGLFDKAGVQ